MIGAIAGDIVGSVFERAPCKTVEFPLFSPGSTYTDDTVLTVAVAAAIQTGTSYAEAIREFGRRYPNRGYGGMFRQWLMSPKLRPYNSFGNGSAMRVSPVGFLFHDFETVLAEAEKSARCTHDHPEGIKGAQATAMAIFLARVKTDKAIIRRKIEDAFAYDLGRTLAEIRPAYTFDVTCQGSVPEAIICFLEAGSWEEAVRNAVSLGGDADTQACIAGGIAEAYFGVPKKIAKTAAAMLPREFRKIIVEGVV